MKTPLIVLIIVAVIAIVIAFFFSFSKKETPAISTPTPTPSPTETITPEITYVDSTPRMALFKSNVPLKNVTLENIRVFTKSASVASAGEEDDFPNNFFKVEYDKEEQTITVTDISSEFGVNFGAFRTNCAACTHEIEFINLETASGIIIPKAQVSIY